MGLVDDLKDKFDKAQFVENLKEKLDYVQIAHKIIKDDVPLYYDSSKVWWQWKINKWVIVDETDIMNSVYDVMRDGGITSSRIKNQIMESFRMMARRNEPKIPSPDWIQFEDVVVDIKNNMVFSPSSKYFFKNVIPYKYELKGETPKIDKFLDDITNGKKEYLFELMAYMLYRDYPIQRFFFLLGSGSNGKGSFMRLVEKFLGKKNMTSSELELLSSPHQRFEKIKLFSKLVCIIPETNVSMLKHTSLLKQLCGGDMISGEFKNKGTLEFQNYAKVIITSNSLPETSDKTIGFYRRCNFIDFPNVYRDGKEVLDTIPNEEFSFLGFKLVGFLKSLISRGSFLNDVEVEERIRKYEERSNPIVKFLEEEVVYDEYCFVQKWELRDAYRAWLLRRNFRNHSDREMYMAFKHEGLDEQRKVLEWVDSDNPPRRWCYVGVRLKNKDIKSSSAGDFVGVGNKSYGGSVEYLRD